MNTAILIMGLLGLGHTQAVKTAARSSAISVLVAFRRQGAELQPAPLRSGHSARLPSAASGPMVAPLPPVLREAAPALPPGPSAGPASAAWILTFRHIHCRCSTPSKAGKSSHCDNRPYAQGAAYPLIPRVPGGSHALLGGRRRLQCRPTRSAAQPDDLRTTCTLGSYLSARRSEDCPRL